MNGVAPVAVPQVVDTVMFPVEAPAGTVAEICVVLFTIIEEVTPLNCTVGLLTKPKPLMITVLPAVPDNGEKLAITGAELTIIEMLLEVEGLPVTHVALLLITQDTW